MTQKKAAKKKAETKADQESPKALSTQSDEEIDDLLEEIDGVLEENAEEFVKNFRQKGGQ
jgi:prokaryotic ubiquitin-like protein Pup